MVLPSYTSPGFRFTSFEMHLGDPRGGLRGSRYTTIYDGSNTCEISVNGSTGGWGAPDPVRQWTISTNLFGKVILEEYSGSISRPPYQNYLISSVIPGDDGRGPFAYKGFPKAGYIEPI